MKFFVYDIIIIIIIIIIERTKNLLTPSNVCLYVIVNLNCIVSLKFILINVVWINFSAERKKIESVLTDCLTELKTTNSTSKKKKNTIKSLSITRRNSYSIHQFFAVLDDMDQNNETTKKH